jgi:putative transposase
MAWRNTQVEHQRENFITACLENKSSISDLCREFGVSRKTGYKWLSRFKDGGMDELKDRCRARHTQPLKTTEELTQKVIKIKHQYLKWGPKKIAAFLEQNQPSESWPSATTIGKILNEHNLTIPRKYRRRFPAKTSPLSHSQQSNDVWCIDFKGWFKTKDNVKCDPMTLTDSYSRFLLYCSKLGANTVDHVWNSLDKAFYQYGLPRYLRHDNGPPFATNGAGRLSRLSVNLIKAGVTPEWIEPGKPYQNGRHERMHLTLQEEGAFPLKLTLKEQQMKFMEFQQYFNLERPHEALGQKTPASIYLPSERVWTGQLRSPEYSQDYQAKRVRASGTISLLGMDIFVGKTLEDEYVGLKEDMDGNWEVYFGPVFLGIINHEKRLIQPTQKTREKSKYAQRIF